jgi:predicted metalloprotease with PDZ domain
MLRSSLRLPSAQWKYATALELASANGADLVFRPVSLETLVDSPLDAGVNLRTFDLGTWDGAPVSLAAFADTPEQLAASEKTVQKMRDLVVQMRALYRNRHWNHYTFLLTVSEVMPGQGVEHHQSSDNGAAGGYLTEDDVLTAGSDLLAHEFNHSWNGKYRRPFDLATPNLQAPMIDDLLWVYEGMTQYYGNLQTERAGFRTEQQWLDALALGYASYDSEHGRLTRPLEDTATSSSFLYRERGAWSSERRGADYYGEGELMWLAADVLIRTRSQGARSLDDFARAFFGRGSDTGPQVVTYTRDDLIAALNAVEPYDWRSFLAAHVDAVAPHPPDFLTGGGYKLVFGDTPTAYAKLQSARRRTLDLRYSLGIVANREGVINDVIPDSVAFRGGIGPGEKIVAVDDRTLSGQPQLDTALRDARGGAPLRLLLTAGNVYRTVALEYRGGPRYPRLVRVDGTADVLGAIAKPLAAVP